VKVLLVGGGGREHAIAEALSRSGAEIYAVMKNRNPGIRGLSRECLYAGEGDVEKIVAFAERKGVDLAVIGPEGPLARGIVDALHQREIPSVGPSRDLAQIEANKAFARRLMEKYRIPGSLRFGVFREYREACEFIDTFGAPLAVKPIGLTGGKGVKVIGEHLRDEAEARAYVKEVLDGGIGGGGVVLEEKAEGEEFTLQAFVDGRRTVSMPCVQDHKRAYEGDTGPNTGGMGSYSLPDALLPFLSKEACRRAEEILEATVRSLREEIGKEYRGILYGQFMLGREGPKVIEFNARFGDPEAMNVLPLLSSDFLEICARIVEGSLHRRDVAFRKEATVCKYVVPEGYGVNPISGQEITVDEAAVRAEGGRVYYAAVNEKDGRITTTSSRSLGVVGIDPTLEGAERIAEASIRHIRGRHLYHRRDIGTRELIEKKRLKLEKLSA
jgi:phosphoribosylamine--glycine ligase